VRRYGSPQSEGCLSVHAWKRFERAGAEVARCYILCCKFFVGRCMVHAVLLAYDWLGNSSCCWTAGQSAEWLQPASRRALCTLHPAQYFTATIRLFLIFHALIGACCCCCLPCCPAGKENG
jgi:hypothetical protein